MTRVVPECVAGEPCVCPQQLLQLVVKLELGLGELPQGHVVPDNQIEGIKSADLSLAV